MLVPLGSALLAALVTLVGDHWRQNRIGRRTRAAEDLKHRLYDFLALIADYWMGDQRDSTLEAKILATKLIVVAEFLEMSRHSTRLGRWYRDTQECRLDMMDVATGGCFQQVDWTPDPVRVTGVAREVGRIVRTLREAC